jgi:hypothetical protein
MRLIACNIDQSIALQTIHVALIAAVREHQVFRAKKWGVRVDYALFRRSNACNGN